MPRLIKWGVLGLGKIAHKFVSDLQLVADCKLEAVASSNTARAAAFAGQHGATRFYGSYQDLFADDQVEIIYIASLNQDHYAHTLAALKNKKAVLCEKPLAINQKQVLEMIRCAREHQTFLMEGLWTRFNPTFGQLQQWIAGGEIGALRYLNATFSFNGLAYGIDSRLFNPDKAGGSLLDIGIYPLFLAYQLLGIPKSIQASAVKAPTGVDEQIAMILSYDKAHAILYSSFSHNEDMRATICGEEGEIYMDSRWHESPRITLVKGDKQTLKEFEFQGKGYTYEILEANQCLRNDQQESSKWSLQNSLDLVQLMDQIRGETGIKFTME